MIIEYLLYFIIYKWCASSVGGVSGTKSMKDSKNLSQK